MSKSTSSYIKKKLGSVNPCNMMALYDKKNIIIGSCMDTPNNFAVACLINPNVTYGKTYYQRFGEEIRTRESVQDRIDMYQQDIDSNDIEEINRHKMTINFI